MFEIQQIINNLGIETKSERIMSLFRFLPIYFTKDVKYFNTGNFGQQPVASIKDENNITQAIIGISDIPFEEFLKNFGGKELSVNEGFVNIWYNKIRTNIYIKMNKYYQIFLKKDNYYGYLGTLEELVQLIANFNLDLNEIDFITYKDINVDSNVIIGYKTKYGWCGGTHRAFFHFKIGEKINLKEYKILLEHGYLKGQKYIEENKFIEKIKSYANNNGIIKITDEEIAKNLVKRLVQVTS